LGVDAQAEVAQGLCELLVRRGSLRRCDGFGFTAGMAASRYVETNALANEYVLNPELQRDALDGLEALARLPDRQRRLAELQAAGFTYDDISRLSRVTDVASVEAAVVSIDDMASRKVNAVYRFECVSGSDQGDGVALAVRCPRQQSDPGAADYPLVQGSTRPAFRAMQVRRDRRHETHNARKAGLISAPTFGYKASGLERKGGIRLAAQCYTPGYGGGAAGLAVACVSDVVK